MYKKFKKLIVPTVTAIVSLATPIAVHAEELVPSQLTKVSTFSIIDIIRGIIQFILVAAFVLAFIMLLIGGIRWITAGGDEKGVEKARGQITAALIGLVIVLVAFALIKLVETFFGVSIISGGVTVPHVTQGLP